MYSKTGSTHPRPPYEGLTPTQAEQAKSFLSSILIGSVMAKRAVIRLDVGKCISAYRGKG